MQDRCEHTGALRHARGFPALGLLRLLRPLRSASADNALSLRRERRSGRTVGFPRSLSAVYQVRCPAIPLQLRCRYAAGLRGSLPVGDIRTNEGVRHGQAVTAHCNPAHIRQVGAGGSLLRGFTPRVHCRYTFLVCLPDPWHLTMLPSPGFVRAARHPYWRSPVQVALSLSRAAATARARRSFTIARSESASWRSMSQLHKRLGATA